MSEPLQPPARQRRSSRVARVGRDAEAASRFDLSAADSRAQEAHFGVAADQVRHDFVISHVLAALEPLADRLVFYGGTALSRTFLDGLRLSEDIDLLSVGPRAETARHVDEALRSLERGLGAVETELRLQDTVRDTTACTYRIGGVAVQLQLMDGRHYTDWPRQRSVVSQRYAGLADIVLQTYTAEGFVGAKTVAWCDETRNAPRDLYDLWALADRGLITAGAANVYKKHGPIGAYPRGWVLPQRAPDTRSWFAALGHQCIPQVGPDEALELVVRAWEHAVSAAEDDEPAQA